jgi:hypothetical protein
MDVLGNWEQFSFFSKFILYFLRAGFHFSLEKLDGKEHEYKIDKQPL